MNVEYDEMKLNTVLSSIAPIGDFIKNQTAFATYYEGATGWYSSNGLNQLRPGQGYFFFIYSAYL